jgi:hypothetical protein
MTTEAKILQIVPRVPGMFDGVGDHALQLAKGLFDEHGMRTTFLVVAPTAVETKDGFEIVSGFSSGFFESVASSPDHVILHYSNYGYANRGMPFELRNFAQRLRRSVRGKWITVLHELCASGPPWRSAFWTRPFQVKIARDLIDMSDACVVSNRVIAGEIHRYDRTKSVLKIPIMSNLGEPFLDRAQIGSKDPHRWVICGGSALLQKSVRSFNRNVAHVPEHFSPRELFVLGGTENPAVREMLNELREVKWSYQPEIEAAAASEVISLCSFGWLDYFHHPTAPSDALFKSGVFAAFCAHGVIAVLPHQTAPLVWEQETLPRLSFLDRVQGEFPSPNELVEVGWRFYDWYHRHASLKQRVSLIGQALGVESQSALTS